MQSIIPIRGIIPPMLLVFVTFTVTSMSLGADQYAYSQSSNASSAASTTATATTTSATTTSAATTGVNLIDMHPSPVHLKSGSKFEIFSTVINNSPGIISFIAGACDSPLSAHFASNVVIKHTQGCTATSPPFKLSPGDEVSVAGPSSGTIYQAVTPGQTKASVTFHFHTANGQASNVTKPFVFDIG